MSIIDQILDTHRRNQRFAHYDIDTVLVPFEHVRMLDSSLRQQKAAIAADRNLTNEGKQAALEKARAATRAAITEWNERRQSDIGSDLLEKRAALMANVERPDAKRVDLMASHLLKHAPSDIAVFYNSASEIERREMEAASASIGRVPLKTEAGRKLTTLLDPDMVAEAILARAEATNPSAAQRVRELSEIKAMQTTITGVALSEV